MLPIGIYTMCFTLQNQLVQPLIDRDSESGRIPTEYSETDSFYGIVNNLGKNGGPIENPRGYIYEVSD